MQHNNSLITLRWFINELNVIFEFSRGCRLLYPLYLNEQKNSCKLNDNIFKLMQIVIILQLEHLNFVSWWFYNFMHYIQSHLTLVPTHSQSGPLPYTHFSQDINMHLQLQHLLVKFLSIESHLSNSYVLCKNVLILVP